MIIKYFAWLKTITEIDEEFIDDSSITDVDALKNYLINKHPKLKKYLDEKDIIRIAVNLTYTYDNDKLKSNDEIALFPPVSGG
tara:strand:+ start:439 stop:687 length:249 start_codon:yes stop_codon:yes gene_type:complete